MALRMIHVGLGQWGRSWIRDIVSLNTDIELVAYVDISPEILALAQKELGITAECCFTSLEQALASTEADAVLIATNLGGHVAAAQIGLQAGKHLLVEKPFAPSLEEAQHIVAIAEQHKCVLMVSQNYRYYPAIQTAQMLIREHVLGKVGCVHLEFRRDANNIPAGGSNFYKLWQPLLADMSIHHFDLMRFLLGQEPVCVTCQTWNPPWSNFVESAEGAAIIAFDGGTIVHYHASWVSRSSQTNWAGKWRIECEKGEIVVTDGSEKSAYVSIHPLNGRASSTPLQKMLLVDRHATLNAFVKAIKTGEEPDCSGRRNLKTLALMLAAVESSIVGASVDIGI